MAEVGRTRIPHEALLSLRRRLELLPVRHPDRKELVTKAATLYGVSRATLYRSLRVQLRPKPLHRRDRGKPRVVPPAEMERYCEIVAALKLRTMNGKGRHLSTARAIAILEEYGVETPDGLVQTPPGATHEGLWSYLQELKASLTAVSAGATRPESPPLIRSQFVH